MSKTTNKKQLDILISTMQLNVDIARGWSTRNKEEVNKVWRKLESELNAAGPPSKTVPEWKKVWCDQKKYVRHKAAQNFKSSHGTGGGPNMEQTFSATEEAIYNLINMKESVEGVAKTYGLGSSKQNPQSLQSELDDFLLLDCEVLQTSVCNSDNTPEKPPLKKMKTSVQKENIQGSSRDVLVEEISIQKEMLKAMAEQQQNTKKVYRSIDRLCDLKKEMLREQKRHNLVMEQLRLREVEDKIDKNRRLLEIEDLKYSH
ncbi:uncharacterized protein LOC142241543 [Haematobia irritans]|uniref:uncharacterized protein LOC142225642 n=1 Tax=Haematobia irritans TaxID=7368 RepID=UPI003F4F9136